VLVLPSEHPNSIAPLLCLPLFLLVTGLSCSHHQMALCLPDSASMSTCSTCANSAIQTGQCSTSSLLGFTSQAANAVSSALTKLLFQHFVGPLYDNNGNNYNCSSDDTPHQFSFKCRPRTYVLDTAPAMDDWDPTHLHRCWLHHLSPLTSLTKVILGDNGNVSATSADCITVCMHASRQWTCTVLLEAP
jgi:hypothetical protein